MVASKSCGSVSKRATMPPVSRRALRQLPHLPFAQRKQRRLREREKETRPGKNRHNRYSDHRRCRHEDSMAGKPLKSK